MKKITLHEAKKHFSKLIDLVMQGQEVVICKSGNPVARLIPFTYEKKVRKPGVWAGKVTIS